MKKIFEQCESTFEGTRCEQNKNKHRKSFGHPKHNFGGQSWTDRGIERAKLEQVEQEKKQ
jgi:hypothetical protein